MFFIFAMIIGIAKLFQIFNAFNGLGLAEGSHSEWGKKKLVWFSFSRASQLIKVKFDEVLKQSDMNIMILPQNEYYRMCNLSGSFLFVCLFVCFQSQLTMTIFNKMWTEIILRTIVPSPLSLLYNQRE